ncbi:MAG: hypothetical protein AB7O68_19955 [Pirellulales bacterium]
MSLRNDVKQGHAPNLRHGGFARQPLAALPRKFDYLRKKVARFRAELESAVVAAHGSINRSHAAAIQSAAMHHGLSELWARRLRDEPDMAHAALVEATDRISRELDRRDAAIARLGIDQPAKPDYGALFGDQDDG